jgi:hypothetical protein
LRTGSAFPISFAYIAVTPGNGYDIEAAAHAILDRHRCAGEWFDVSPELAISALTGGAARLGQPMQSVSQEQADLTIRLAAMGEDQANRLLNTAMSATERTSFGCTLLRLIVGAALAIIFLTVGGGGAISAYEAAFGVDQNGNAGAVIVLIAVALSIWLAVKASRRLIK